MDLVKGVLVANEAELAKELAEQIELIAAACYKSTDPVAGPTFEDFIKTVARAIISKGSDGTYALAQAIGRYHAATQPIPADPEVNK